MSEPRIRYHLNVRAALILTGFGLAAALILYFLEGYQETRALRSALAQVRGFHAAGAEEKDPEKRARDNDLALRHLNQYLASRPEDPDGLEIQAELLSRVNPLSAIPIYEHFLRLPYNRDDPKAVQARQQARLRLAELDIESSNLYLGQRLARIMPEETAHHLKYSSAEMLADQLLDPETNKLRVHEAEAHRIKAMALEGYMLSGKPGDTLWTVKGLKDKGGKNDESPEKIELQDYTIREYQAALKLDPRDLKSAFGLARIYLERKKDTASARKVMEDLSKSAPDSVDVHLACRHFFKNIGEDKKAAEELKAAARWPEHLAVILAIVEDAMKGDHDQRLEARRRLGMVPKDAPPEVRVRVLWALGYIESLEQNPRGAINAWEQGLELSEGTDPALTLQLAKARLDRGEVDRAAELVNQYRRLVGGDHPYLPWLEGLLDERAGRLHDAIERLERVRDNKQLEADRYIQGQVRLALGRCYVKRGELENAEEYYRQAIQFAPGSAAPQYELAQMLMARKPEEAVKVLEQTLASSPDDPTLLVALAAARFQEQIARPSNRRNWASFDDTFGRATAAVKRAALGAKQSEAETPASLRLDLIHAQRLVAGGQLDDASQFLKQAVAQAPRSVELAVLSADVLVRQGHLDQALKVLEQASAPEAAGDRGVLRNARAQVLAAMNRGREARTLLVRDVGKLSPADRADVWRTLSMLCQSRGDRETTRAAYSEWARQLPDDDLPRFALLEMDFADNDARAIHDRLDELDPGRHKGGRNDREDLVWKMAQAREQLWRRSHEQEEPTRAAQLEKADGLMAGVDLTSTNPVALLLKGQILDEGGKVEDAIKFYARASSGGSPEAMLRLVDRLANPRSKHAERKQELDRLRQSDPTKQLDMYVATAYLRHDDRNEAARVVEQSSNDPAGAKFWQFQLFELLGDSSKAEGVLKKLVEQQPDRLELWLTLVRHQATHDRARDATETIAEIMRRFKATRPELLEAQCRSAASDLPGSEKAFDEAFRRYPDDPDVLLALAVHFQGTGRADRAEACLRHILDRNPKDQTAARELAVLLSDRPPAWAQALALLGPEGPPNDTAEDRLARGVVLARGPQAEQRKRGVDILDELVADLPAENKVAITARDYLARVLIASGQAARASRVAATSALTGSDPAAIALYAEALIQSGQLDTAQDQLDRLAREGAGGASEANLRARLIQGRALRNMGSPALAASKLEDEYHKREGTPGGELFGREAFALLMAMGPEAREAAGRLAGRLAKRHGSLSWMPALVLNGRGNRDEALALCRAAAEAGKDPRDLREACRVALEIAVASRVESSLLDRAGEVLDAALRHAPDADDLLVMRAMISHVQGRYDDEVRLYRIVLKNQPRHFLVLNNLAYALSEGLDKPAEGLEKINELLAFTGGRNAEYLDTRGVILMHLGQLTEAIRDLEEATGSAPNGVHFFHLARAYQAAGRAAESRTAFKQGLQAGLTPEMLDPRERASFEKLRDL